MHIPKKFDVNTHGSLVRFLIKFVKEFNNLVKTVDVLTETLEKQAQEIEALRTSGEPDPEAEPLRKKRKMRQTMKKTKILIMIMVLVFSSTCLGAMRISHRTVQPARALARLLNDRIGTLDDQVATLQALSGGVYDNIGTGDVFYVDSATGSDTDTGVTWALAKATLDAAIGLCGDGNNDVIYVASGHAETLAADITADFDGITIIGIGSGTDKPEFTFDTTTDEFIIDAQGVTVYNCSFIAGVAEVAACFTLADESDYFSIISCEFPEPGTATFEFDVVFQLVTGADNGTIAYCTVINQGATPGMTSVIDGGDAAIDSLAVIGNHFNVDADVALIFSDQADTNLIISGNTLIQEDTDKFCIELTSTAMGIISDNKFFNLGGTSYLIDPGSCGLFENYAGITTDTSAAIYPATAATEAQIAELGTAEIFYVDSAVGGSLGTSWATAVGTFEEAIALCAASRGDIIYAAQGHAENFTAEDLDIDKIGITIIGCGRGSLRPTITYTNANGEVAIGANSVTIRNIRFIASVTGVLMGIEVENGFGYFTIEDCEFTDAGDNVGTDEFIEAINFNNDNTGCTIRNCRFIAKAAGAASAIMLDADTDVLTIEGCDIRGTYGTACIAGDTAPSTNLLIRNNLLVNGSLVADGGLNAFPAISVLDSTAGIVMDNRIVSDVGSALLMRVADDMTFLNNFVTDTDGDEFSGTIESGASSVAAHTDG